MTGSIKFISNKGIRLLNVNSMFFQKTVVDRNGKKTEITPKQKAEGLAMDFNAHTFELTSDKKTTVYTRVWDNKKRLFSWTSPVES